MDKMTLTEHLNNNNNFISTDLKKSCIDHLTLKASINGVEGTFILDTASNISVIDKSKRIRFKLKQTSPVKNSIGVQESQYKTIHSAGNEISIAGSTLKNFKLSALSLIAVNNEIKNRKGEPIDGLIGGDVLTKLNAVIVYANLKLYLTKTKF